MGRTVALVASLMTLVTILVAPSLLARQSTGAHVPYEYLRLAPTARQTASRGMGALTGGYDACRASDVSWTCRAFEGRESSDDSLPRALTTLGREGWELVAVIDETEQLSSPKGLTYFFRRRQSE